MEFKLDRIETSWSYNIHNSLFKCNEWKQFGGRNCYYVTWITRQKNEENLIDLFKTLSLYQPDIDNKSKRLLRNLMKSLLMTKYFQMIWRRRDCWTYATNWNHVVMTKHPHTMINNIKFQLNQPCLHPLRIGLLMSHSN